MQESLPKACHLLKSKSQIWEVIFEKKKVLKNDQKSENLIFGEQET